MMTTNEAHDLAIDRCPEGYLIDPGEWDWSVAEALAREEGIELTEDHRRVIEFMRDYYDQHRIAVDARFVLAYLAEGHGDRNAARSELYRLFPYGYVKQACKIAGMKRPRAWSTG